MYRFFLSTTLLLFTLLFSSSTLFAFTFTLGANTVGTPTSGTVVIDFIDGDGLDNSSATINNLSAPASFFDGTFSEPTPGEFTVDDSGFFSSLYIDLVDIYSGFSFDFDATFSDPGMFGFPDSMVVSLLDEFYFPLFPTSDPTGADALAVMSFMGTDIYELNGFTVSITETNNAPVPEPSTWVLLSIGLIGLFYMRRRKINPVLPIVLLMFFSLPAHAAFENVTANVSIERSPLVYSRTSQTFNSVVKITNISENIINSPMFIVVTNIPETVSVNNAVSLSAEGSPIVSVPVYSEGLAPGQSVEDFIVKFHNPNRVRFTAGFTVMAGRGDLPPNPGTAGNETLQGVDSNGNGVRDDIEIYIDLNYGDQPKVKEGLTQYAHTVQNGIVATNQQDSIQAANAQTRAIECLMYIDQRAKPQRRSNLKL